MPEEGHELMRKMSVAVSAALMVALLVWLTLSSHQAEESRRAARSEEIQTLTVLHASSQVLRAMQNAETGQRGYMLTRDKIFLDPLRIARGDLPIAIANLREITLADPASAVRARRIEELATSRMRMIERSLELLEQGRFNRASLVDYLRNGKQAMDELRRELGALEKTKQASLRRSQALAQRNEALAGQWRELLTLFTIILAVLCAAMVVGLLKARRENREQQIRAKGQLMLDAGRHLLQSIIDSSQNLIFVKTGKREVLFANAEFRRIVRRPLEELHGVPLPPTDDPQEAELLAEADSVALVRGERTDVFLRLEVDGELRWYCVEKNPWIRDGKIIGVIGIARDVSESKGREEELERRVAARTAQLESALLSVRREMTEREAAQETLRQLQKIESLGQLTGGIAHDFNNMLAVVMGSLDTMRRKLPEADAKILLPLIETALAGATSAADLTSRLLAFARQQKLDPTPVEINALVTHTRTLLARTLGKNIKVVLDLDPDAGWVEVDNSQLENALVNLAVNSRDAMPAGGRLTISTQRQDETIRIVIEDTGQGMTAEQLSRVFDPFYTTKDIGMGTGLGLSQVHGFVAQSGGQIDIASTPRVGTTVSIVLPACQQPAAAEPTVVQPSTQPGNGELILLVEDEALVRISTKASLQALGYRVVAAAQGYEALTCLEDNPDIALMITDISMPGLDGRDLADAAQLLRPDIAVLLTTGHEHGRIRGDGLAVLTKPYLLDELAAVVSRLLKATGRTEQARAIDNSAHHGAAGKEARSGGA